MKPNSKQKKKLYG